MKITSQTRTRLQRVEAKLEEKDKQRTVFDCVKEDIEQLKNVQNCLDLLIGHEESMKDGEVHTYYRGHKFIITLAKEI